jgi:hypothetical protein
MLHVYYSLCHYIHVHVSVYYLYIVNKFCNILWYLVQGSDIVNKFCNILWYFVQGSDRKFLHSSLNIVLNYNVKYLLFLSIQFTDCSWSLHNISHTIIKWSWREPCNCFLVLVWFWFMVFNATFNNISVVSWQSVLLVVVTRVSGENHRPVASHWQTLSHNIVTSTSRKIRNCQRNRIGCSRGARNTYNTLIFNIFSLTTTN